MLGPDAAVAAAAVLAACVVGYLTFAVPGAWFPHASPKTWNANDLTLARGVGRISGDELLLASPDAKGIALVTVTTDFRSTEYAGAVWVVSGLQEDADVRLLWRTDVEPVALLKKAKRDVARIKTVLRERQLGTRGQKPTQAM